MHYTSKGLATSIRIAQERHRRLENERVGRLEVQTRKQRAKVAAWLGGEAQDD